MGKVCVKRHLEERRLCLCRFPTSRPAVTPTTTSFARAEEIWKHTRHQIPSPFPTYTPSYVPTVIRKPSTKEPTQKFVAPNSAFASPWIVVFRISGLTVAALARQNGAFLHTIAGLLQIQDACLSVVSITETVRSLSLQRGSKRLSPQQATQAVDVKLRIFLTKSSALPVVDSLAFRRAVAKALSRSHVLVRSSDIALTRLYLQPVASSILKPEPLQPIASNNLKSKPLASGGTMQATNAHLSSGGTVPWMIVLACSISMCSVLQLVVTMILSNVQPPPSTAATEVTPLNSASGQVECGFVRQPCEFSFSSEVDQLLALANEHVEQTLTHDSPRDQKPSWGT